MKISVAGLGVVATMAVLAAGCTRPIGLAAKAQAPSLVPPGPRPAAAPPPAAAEFNTEAYDRIEDNPFLGVDANPVATFSADVDTASYANVRRFLNQGTLPPPDSVRIEELVNYFVYRYPEPAGAAPLAVSVTVAECPWAPEHQLARIALRARPIAAANRPKSNLVFLLDVSGSMDEPNKLPLLKNAMKLLVDQLTENDRVALVVYAGAAGLVLPSTTGDQKEVINAALDKLGAGGSTAGGDGLKLAYATARANFIPGGINRVILATDGDFNVGITSEGDLTRLIETEAKSGIALTALGFGMGNYKDSTLEKLADKGDGNYGYIDSINEARKLLVSQAGGTLVTVAKDVKIQVEFNPAVVKAYRLLGYENRLLRREDFNDDTKDAGDMGAGHTVTAFFELVPAGAAGDVQGVDPLKYQQPGALAPASASGEVMTVKVRYKDPAGGASRLIEVPVAAPAVAWLEADPDFKFAAAVAAFGMLLRDSPHKGTASWAWVSQNAEAGLDDDEGGYRQEFVALIEKARRPEHSDRPATDAKP